MARDTLAKDREQRYSSVGDVRRDIENFLASRPVDARRQTRGYLLWKFLQRHRLAAAVVTVLLFVLTGSGAWITASEVAASERLDEFRLFGLSRRLRSLDDRERLSPLPGSIENAAPLERWIGEIERVLAERPRMQQKLEKLRSELVQDGDQESFEEGHAARLELVDAIEDTLARADTITSPAGTLTLARTRLAWTRETSSEPAQSEALLWGKVNEELAQDERFQGVKVTAKPGLVPLGKDPVTNLQEFAYVLPGSRLPTRMRDNGMEIDNFALNEDSAIVFVLLPGGPVMLGSQADDPDKPNYDLDRSVQEPGLHRVQVEPFYLSKYELTRGQWRKMLGHVTEPFPSYTSTRSAVYPVTTIEKVDIDYALVAWRLRLPTMSEWEYAARCCIGDGPFPRWWVGDEFQSLAPFVNVADQALLDENGQADDEYGVPWNDGFPVMAPVNSMQPNALGLWHVLGNVNELCAVPEGATRMCGGSWHQGWIKCRPTHSTNWEGEAKRTIGLRPAMSLRP